MVGGMISKALGSFNVKIAGVPTFAAGYVHVPFTLASAQVQYAYDEEIDGWPISAAGRYNDGVIYIKTKMSPGGLGNRIYVYGDSRDNEYVHNDSGFSGLLGAYVYMGYGDDYAVGSKLGANSIYGNMGNDTVFGGGGNDYLHGGNGNDKLDGSAGSDKIQGGKGADKLIGGAGEDVFYFGYLSESTMESRDTIDDFVRSDDIIDISDIDSRSDVSGNNSAIFIGESDFSGVSGQLRYVKTNTDTYIYLDVDGDETSDFSIRLLWSMDLNSQYFDL